jgi:hypothetical protein
VAKADGRDHAAGDVEAGPLLGRVGGRASRGDQRDQAEDGAEAEDRVPGEGLQQGAGDEQTEQRAAAGDSRPDRDRPVALLDREDVGDDREGGRHDRRGGQAHHRADGDQRAGAVDEEGGAGRTREHDQPAQEKVPPTERVPQRAGQEQEPGEDDGVGIDEPLKLGLRGAQVAGEVGEGDVQRRDGADDRPERQAHCCQYERASPRVEVGLLGLELSCHLTIPGSAIVQHR